MSKIHISLFIVGLVVAHNILPNDALTSTQSTTSKDSITELDKLVIKTALEGIFNKPQDIPNLQAKPGSYSLIRKFQDSPQHNSFMAIEHDGVYTYIIIKVQPTDMAVNTNYPTMEKFIKEFMRLKPVLNPIGDEKTLKQKGLVGTIAQHILQITTKVRSSEYNRLASEHEEFLKKQNPLFAPLQPTTIKA